MRKKSKPTRAQYVAAARPLLEAAARELQKARNLELPDGSPDDKLDFQIAVLGEEVGDVYTRLQDLSERVQLEAGS